MFVFFFKQKTAYEMCISDWSSDVCSSDLSRVVQAAILPMSDTQRSRMSLSLTSFSITLESHAAPRAGRRRGPHPRAPTPVPIFRPDEADRPILRKIGRASWRERVCRYV